MKILLPEARTASPLPLANGAWLRGWRIPGRLNVWEWADRYRVLTRETSKETGPWRTDRTPYLREIMWSVSLESPVQQITFLSGTQLGKTEVVNNFVGYVMGYAGGSILVVEPTGDMAMRWSRQRLDVMIENTPALRRRVRPARSRDANNTAKMKRYPGGYLIIGQAESPTSLSSLPARYVFMDEVDSYPLDTDDEGDPVTIAARRTDSFGRLKKVFLVSSPKKIKGLSIIWREYQLSDQRLFPVPCPRCDHRQPLELNGLLHTGEYLCEACGRAIPHSAKTDMMQAGEWVAKHPDRSAIHRGYRLPSLYAPIGLGPTWADLHAEREKAGSDPVHVKTFIMTRSAEPYESVEGKIEAEDLKACLEDWALREIPPAAMILTASVDVQINRFAIKILGWGRGPQCWLIDWVELPGSPLEPESWNELDRYLDKPLVNQYGVPLPIRLKAVDSGNWTDQVYAFVREHQEKGYIAIKGHNAFGKPLISRPTLVDVSVRGKTLKGGLKLYLIGVDTAKDTLLERLALVPVKSPEQRWFHLPRDLPDDWFEQITAERRDPETNRWIKVKRSARNEAIDCLVYGYAAACHPRIRLHQMREVDWKRLEERYQPANLDLFSQALGAPETPPKARRTVVMPSAPASAPQHGFGSEEWSL